jgi:hypothetical protein
MAPAVLVTPRSLDNTWIRGIAMSNGTQRVAIADLRPKLASFGTPTIQAARRLDHDLRRLDAFMRNGFGIETIDEITAEHAELFVKAKAANGEPPSVATMHLRRYAIRLLFRIARMEFGCSGDPARDVVLPPRSSSSTRPLTEEEVVLGRSFSLYTLTATRHAAAWALGEASATTAELPHIVTDDLDLDNANGPRVWLHGSRKRNKRWGLLDDWGATQLERRASAITGKRLIYRGDGSEESQQASCCIAISDTLVRAGLAKEPDVRPASLTAWVGTVALQETGSIDGVARRLGYRSLDAAARLINFDW